MKKRGITRRTLVTGAAALASYQALADGLSGSMSPQLGGTIDIDGFDGGLGIVNVWLANLPPGYGYRYYTDDSGNNQIILYQDASGNFYPLIAPLP